MDIIPAKNDIHIISITYSELQNKHITAEFISSALGISPLPKNTTVEIYDSCDALLIFVCLPRLYYAFDDFEEVIAACGEYEDADAALYYYDGQYILSVSATDIFFSEFGCILDTPDNFDLFLKEHGKVLIPHDAVNFVKNTF